MLPRRPALAGKWKRGPRQRSEGHGAAAQSLLTAVQTQPARQTTATLPPVALQPLLVVVPPPPDTSPQPPASPIPAQSFEEEQVSAAQRILSAVQVPPPHQIAMMLPPADLQPQQVTDSSAPSKRLSADVFGCCLRCTCSCTGTLVAEAVSGGHSNSSNCSESAVATSPCSCDSRPSADCSSSPSCHGGDSSAPSSRVSCCLVATHSRVKLGVSRASLLRAKVFPQTRSVRPSKDYVGSLSADGSSETLKGSTRLIISGSLQECKVCLRSMLTCVAGRVISKAAENRRISGPSWPKVLLKN